MIFTLLVTTLRDFITASPPHIIHLDTLLAIFFSPLIYGLEISTVMQCSKIKRHSSLCRWYIVMI